MVTGVKYPHGKEFRSPFCESCIITKATRISILKTPGSSHHVPTPSHSKRVRFSDEVSRSPRPPSSLHATPQTLTPPLAKLAVDLKGPIILTDTPPSAKKYCLLFTCVSTRFRFAAFLKSKDEAVNYTEKLIHYLRSINHPITSLENTLDSADQTGLLHFPHERTSRLIPNFSDNSPICRNEIRLWYGIRQRSNDRHS
jgi:hypothetical protein